MLIEDYYRKGCKLCLVVAAAAMALTLIGIAGFDPNRTEAPGLLACERNVGYRYRRRSSSHKKLIEAVEQYF
jgi:hypothetical protein